MQAILRGADVEEVPAAVTLYLSIERRKRVRYWLGLSRAEAGALPVSVSLALDEIGTAIRDFQRRQDEQELFRLRAGH